jgi:hypothetical protein
MLPSSFLAYTNSFSPPFLTWHLLKDLLPINVTVEGILSSVNAQPVNAEFSIVFKWLGHTNVLNEFPASAQLSIVSTVSGILILVIPSDLNALEPIVFNGTPFFSSGISIIVLVPAYPDS